MKATFLFNLILTSIQPKQINKTLESV